MTWADLDTLAKGHGIGLLILCGVAWALYRRVLHLEQQLEQCRSRALDVAMMRADKLDQLFAVLVDDSHEPRRALVARILATPPHGGAEARHGN